MALAFQHARKFYGYLLRAPTQVSQDVRQTAALALLETQAAKQPLLTTGGMSKSARSAIDRALNNLGLSLGWHRLRVRILGEPGQQIRVRIHEGDTPLMFGPSSC